HNQDTGDQDRPEEIWWSAFHWSENIFLLHRYFIFHSRSHTPVWKHFLLLPEAPFLFRRQSEATRRRKRVRNAVRFPNWSLGTRMQISLGTHAPSRRLAAMLRSGEVIGQAARWPHSQDGCATS